LPLKTPPPMEIAALPEHVIDDVCDFFLFISRYI
jgi:hypothetical protein